MIEEKEIEVRGRKYIISKVPATVGREILFKYPTSNIPKVGDYGQSQEIMLKLLSYVAAVTPEGQRIELKTQTLVDNHVPNAETLILLEKEMFSYNFDFFHDGNASNFLKALEKRATSKGIEMLTTLLERLSQTGKPHSKS